MSIASEITRLQGVKSDILTAIADKGVTVPSGSKLDDCPGLIAEISGGGDVSVRLQAIVPVSGGIRVCDADGYVGGNYMGAYYPQSYNFYNNFAIVIDGADFSQSGLGSVTLLTPSTDQIGGRTYRTVTMPDGKTWLAENLDFKFSGCNIGGRGTPSTPNAWYYNNDEATYGIDGVRKCGLLYNWHAVKLLNDNRSELIPGWHVSTTAEWDALANAVGGTSVAGTVLKAANVDWATSWGGTDDYGFGILPAGTYDGSFYDVGSGAYFWTSAEYSSSTAYYRYFGTGSSMASDYSSKNNVYSVRLVKDS